MEWKTVKLGDYIQDIAAGPFGSNLKVECFVPDGFPIIDGANLRGYTMTDNVTKFVTEEKARSLYRSIAKRGEVVVTISGNVGQIAYIPYDSKYEEYLVSQRQFRVKFKDSVNVPYLVYYFHSREGQHQILSFANQTGVPALAQPLKNFRNIEFPLPPLETQRRIAAILSSLDDKIENNNRINRNLESQAQALFKSWCVDFEPFGGTMPEDWKEGTLGDIIAEIESGSRPKGGAQISGIPSIGAEKIERFGVYDFSGEKYVSEEFFHKMKRGHVKDGDVMLYKDGAYTGKCSMALDGFPYNLCAVNEHVFLLRTKEAKYQFYLYLNMIQDSVRSMIYTLACSKAAQPGLNTSEVLGVKTIIPTEAVMMDFNSKVANMMHTIANNCLESHRLAALRDTLLPKLMRGEITL